MLPKNKGSGRTDYKLIQFMLLVVIRLLHIQTKLEPKLELVCPYSSCQKIFNCEIERHGKGETGTEIDM